MSVLWLAGCSDGSGPSRLDPLHLAVVVEADSAVFRNAGEFALDLVPSDRSGRTYLADPWTITSNLTAPSAVVAMPLGQGVEPGDTQPVAAALLIDDSGSMRFSDPDRIRATAAQLFWSTVLPGRPGNQVALLDFGRGDAMPTAGFARTTLLAGFSSDAAALDQALTQVQAVPGGATPLYQSGLEVVKWMDSTTPAHYRRVLVVITDGAPSDPGVTQELYDVAQASGARVFAVGIGAAAHEDPPSDAAVRLQELASRTGGIYGAANPPEELQPVLQSLAQSASPERLLLHLRLEPIPPPGTVVSGTVTVAGTLGSASADWSFTAR